MPAISSADAASSSDALELSWPTVESASRESAISDDDLLHELIESDISTEIDLIASDSSMIPALRNNFV